MRETYQSKTCGKEAEVGGDEAEPVLGRSLIDVFASLKNGNVSSYEKFKRAFYAAINDGEKMCAYSIAYIDSSKSKAHASSGNKRRSPRLIEGNTRGVRRTLMPSTSDDGKTHRQTSKGRDREIR